MLLQKVGSTVVLAVSLLMQTSFAHAQAGKVPGINAEKAAGAAGDMYRSYLRGGINGMLAFENTCWAGLEAQNNSEAAVTCSVTALAGSFIEAAYAKQEGRVPVPAYNSYAFKQRIFDNMAKAGIGKDRAQSIVESALVNHQGPILVGLMSAGMR